MALARVHPARSCLILALSLLGAGMPSPGRAVQVPQPATARGGEFLLSVGRTLYSSDAFCRDSRALLAVYRVSKNWEKAGVSVAFINNRYPWPPDEQFDGGPESYLTRGESWQAVFEVFPLALLAPDAARSGVGLYLRPFIGVGAQRTGDGEPEADLNGLPVLALEGQTDFLATYGASLYLPGRNSPLGLQIQVRGTTLFPSEFVTFDVEGESETLDGARLTWPEVMVGLSVRH